jgi:sulfofructose kinase
VTPPRWDVVGVGENSVDLIVRLPARLDFGPGAKLQVEPPASAVGGQVVTAVCTCAALGLRAAYVGAFGEDDHGRFARQELERRGVDTSTAQARRAANRQAVILVDARGERSVLWSRDPALALRPDDLPEDMLRDARAVHVDGVDADAALHAAGIARQAGAIVTCDIDRADAPSAALFDAVTHPVVAEPVPSALTGEPDVEKALRILRRRHAGPICVTLGARGALLLDGDRLHAAPAPDVDAVDTTGAGDVFRGAYITAMLEGMPLERALRFATAAAAVSCTRRGAVAGVPTRGEIDDLLVQRRG